DIDNVLIGVYESRDGGRTWVRLGGASTGKGEFRVGEEEQDLSDFFFPLGLVVDPTRADTAYVWVRAPINFDGLLTQAVQILKTQDGGETWESRISDELPPGGNLNLVLADDGHLVNTGREILRCRDGRLVGIAPAHLHKKGSLLGVMESLDNGKTWSAAQYILPEGSDPVIISGVTDEMDLVELADGRILVVIRTDTDIKALGLPSEGTYGPCQTYLTRIGAGKCEATPPTWTPMPHGGHPALVRGADGVIWYWCTDGHWYSVDDGQTWRPTPARLISYYGKMLLTGPNQVLCVTQYLIHDSPYPYSLDSCIRQYRFSYRRSGILQQSDAGASLALASRSSDKFTDLHIRADVRIDGANGIAFRVQPDGRSYYIFAVVLPDSQAYKLWFPPEVEAQKLAAPH
ncbi:MAG: sialidase family protein, partial [Dehalococcoidia bacterium]|nr:sialidase family protein [Dehalococcoidia bacterium]